MPRSAARAHRSVRTDAAVMPWHSAHIADRSFADPRCPAMYSFSYFGMPCPAVGLSCAYPGAGDGTANGCFATAMMWCHGEGGVGDLDGGADAGPGTWTVAQ